MKLKLDENLGAAAVELLRSAGHDVETVYSQGLAGAGDQNVIEASRREGRCLVTLDLDFGNPLLFAPSEYPGIVVLRLPPKPSFDDLLVSCRTLVQALKQAEIAGKLWIVGKGRIREYRPETLQED